MGNKIKEILVDMDGVLFDYEKFFNENAPNHISYYQDREKKEEFDEIKSILIKEKEIYKNLDFMPDGKALYEELLILAEKYNVNLSVMTATGKLYSDMAAKQKEHCVSNKIPKIPFAYVVRSKHKARHATPNTILIDDREKSIKPFVEMGGIGILHKNTKNTIKELKNIFKEL